MGCVLFESVPILSFPHSRRSVVSSGPSGIVLFGSTLYLMGFVVWVNQARS